MAAYTTIDDPEAYFQIKQYTGNDTDGHAITFDGTTDMQPDLVWIKAFAADYVHQLVDSVRGVNKPVRSNANTAEQSLDDSFDSFDSDGFTLGADAATDNFNHSQNYISWNWKAGGGSGSSNTDGSINTTSTSVNTTSGFSISTYTGTGSNATIGHGLGSAPEVVICKERSATQKWIVYNKSLGATNTLHLDTTEAIQDNSAFQDTDPTSSVFSVGTIVNSNESSGTYVAYSFAPKQGFSKFGTYKGNGDADGPMVFTGFRPAFIIGRNTTASQHWFMVDANRSPYNGDSKWFKADGTNAQLTNLVNPDFLANGFKIRSSDDIYNDSGETHVYWAFAEAPLVNSGGVPGNAK